MHRAPRTEARLSQIVASHVSRKFGCLVTTELKLPGCIFDVVGFNPETEAFYVIETKLGSKPASIGHTFGQVLAYEAVISQNGYEFMSRLFNKLNSEGDHVSLDVLARVLGERTVDVYRYVALTDDACRNYQLIRDLRAKLTTDVGVIRYDGRCREFLISDTGKKDYEICRSAPVSIGIAKRYSRREEFFDEVNRRLAREHPELSFSGLQRRNAQYVQWRFGHSGFHLESHATKKRVTLSLDAELETRRQKLRFFRLARNQIRKAGRSIRGLKSEKQWRRKGRWGRIILYEESPVYDDNLVEKAVSILGTLYVALKPVIDRFEGSRSVRSRLGQRWIRVHANLGGRRYEAELSIPSNRMRWNGKEFSSPSALAVEITHTARNGWKVWKYNDEFGHEQLINVLRSK